MSLEAQYQVYHNLETAEARMLLPLKVGQFPVLHDNVKAAPETAATEDLPTCVGVDEVPPAFRFVFCVCQVIVLRPIVCIIVAVKGQHCPVPVKAVM
jgi:hypothetical protein